MKRLLAIWLATCLMLMGAALATEAAQDVAPAASKLPAPEEVAALEDAAPEEEPEAAPDGEETEAEPGDATGEEPDGESAEEPDGEAGDLPEGMEAPEADPTEAEGFALWFEEGFGLTLPAGWVSYAVDEADQAAGVRYALGDESGEHLLYIQFKPTQIADIGDLSAAVEDSADLEKTGDLSFGGRDFVAFIDARQNASCCATLLGGEMAVFIFTPQTDSDYMLTVSRLMEGFTVL